LAESTPCAGTPAGVSGWGSRNSSDKGPDKLRFVEVTVKDRNKCQQAYNLLAELLADETPEAGTEALITGWGDTDANDTDSSSNTLQGTFVTIHDQQSCREIYSIADYFITDSMICVNNNGTGVCKGDSGGPLVNLNGKLIGLASWHLGCDKPYVPDIYTNVVVFKDWILSAANIKV